MLNNLKKIIAFVLVLAMVIAFAGCSKDSGEGSVVYVDNETFVDENGNVITNDGTTDNNDGTTNNNDNANNNY